MEIPVTLTLIFANVAFSIWAFYSNPIYFERFSEWPYQIIHERRYYQMLTSAFLHANYIHLFFNMFTLYMFGSYLERLFVANEGVVNGRIDFFLIYFISLLFGSLVTLIFRFKNSSYQAVGASGAVSGIVFSYIIFEPFSKIFVFFVPMPAFVFAFLYVGVSIYGMKSKFGHIGHEAHLGGAIAGLVSTFVLIDGSFRYFINHFKF
jgi:membrane associated rhomboid family serine protease